MHKIQTSFNSGEWAPNLYARVDVDKYKSAAALLLNFFVDYRGGASTRPGTKYVLQAYDSTAAVRIIPFQASFTISYALEFGDRYIRFYTNGEPVLESGLSITGISKANPCVVSVTNSYSIGDWVYISGISGMTELNGRYFIVHAASGTNITLYDLFGNAVNSTTYGTWSAGGTVQRVYTIDSPYAAADIFDLKYVQDTTDLIICHPSYPPQILSYVNATSWTISPIAFGSTSLVPTNLVAATTLSAGSVNYSYAVTSVDVFGNESQAATVALANKQDLRTTAGSNSLSWGVMAGAVSYNVYKSDVSYSNPVPSGMAHGFVGNVTGTAFTDSNISPDYTIGPPVARNPFAAGSPVIGGIVTNGGSYTTNVAITFSAPSSGVTATGYAIFQAVSATVSAAGGTYAVNDTITYTGGVVVRVTSVGGPSAGVATVTVIIPGTVSSIPTNPLSQLSTSGSGTGATLNFTWTAIGIGITNGGSGYLTAPTITFASGAATATATIGASSSGYPATAAFFQQRLVLAGLTTSPQTLYCSQTGLRFNYNISNPVVDSDAIAGKLVSGTINNIKSLVAQPGGLLVFTDGGTKLVNGGSPGSAITPTALVDNSQSYDGASDLQPIVANYDILFVSSRGYTVRDITYNFYTNVFAGTDITTLSSHLFFGYTIVDWAWAQEPYKIVYCVRNDGSLLNLTFIKDQEFIAWTHSNTTGSFKSICSIIESDNNNVPVNAVYVVVEREIQGQTLQYIERFDDRNWTSVTDAWCVDAGFRYTGSPATSFTGGEHLAGETVTGLADGEVIAPFTMPADGTFTLAAAASTVVVGLGFTAQLQTMGLDIANIPETIQGKVKAIPAVVIRVAYTLGLKIGSSFNNLVTMKDLVLGNVSSMLTGQDTQTVSDLYTGDARTYLDTTYTVPGQYCIQQDQPYPATILGVIPQFTFEQGRNR